eukprot:TRINITY_DN1952_c0_g1_i6.p1 TRINITY_DN1952_c0_g1~~TRINITY_DN1952_c0_g1_i6.p1  ORF type:complete len:219 (-),score=35.77 TRINITY_DN1952_c0_g1_i6:34-690(-)
MYLGPARKAVSYFASVGYECPTYENPADFMMRIIHEDKEEKTAKDESKDKVRTDKTMTSLDSIDGLNSQNFENEELHEKQQVEVFYKKFAESKAYKRSVKVKESPPEVDLSIFKSSKTPFYTQFSKLFIRYMINLSREPNAARANVAQTVIFGVLMGLIFLRMDHSNTSVQDRAGCLFFAAIFIMFGGIMGPFMLFATERKLMMREYLTGLYLSLIHI